MNNAAIVQASVRFPLRANIFCAEIVTFGALYRSYFGERIVEQTGGDYILALAEHLADRFPSTEYELDSKMLPRFVLGSIACSYDEKMSKLLADDISLVGTPRQKLVNDISLAMTAELKSFIANERQKHFHFVPLIFRPKVEAKPRN